MALTNFNPDALLESWTSEKYSPIHAGKTFDECIRAAFNIPKSDTYVYRAQGETTLSITQRVIGAGRSNGLHNWYHSEDGKATNLAHPPPDDPPAYTSLFSPSVSLLKALNAFKANAKSNSLRSTIANHLTTRYQNQTQGLLPNKKDRQHCNPYLDIWAYACHELEWAGPWPNTVHTKISHHILPVLYHHFGCVVPSYAALHVIAKLAQPARPSKEPVKPILDIGSGNGYWTFMLRHFPLDAQMKALDVRAVDNGTSEYRVIWIKDTVRVSGLEYLAQHDNGKGAVLLLVYPQATGDFTAPLLKRFEGDTIVVAGTQNANGFTAFQDCVVDEWVERNLKAFKLVLRVPLPSFAGKDEALFVFQRRKV